MNNTCQIKICQMPVVLMMDTVPFSNLQTIDTLLTQSDKWACIQQGFTHKHKLLFM